MKETAFPVKVSITLDIYTATSRFLYSFGWVCAWDGSWHGEITEKKDKKSLTPTVMELRIAAA